ncbi:ankyrin repeat domain-containing protein [Thalassotalea marina]|uniref:Ankyrin repeat domain-containing protein n=1 Tax=Thalassotalea marina TaxID=1673741 RepID=A0A919BRC3_9GAMM|nr:ankyrin repeat domain-containing protein [Thalassotalea marina]GHG07379.1 hypothetical protein GCM10017161_41270 [Thalassotalea marina]
MSESQEFFNAISNNDLKTAKDLFKNRNVDINFSEPNFNNTPLSYAAYLGLTKCVDYLLSINADLNKPCGLGLTPLMTACCGGKVKGSKIALKLIEKGADVNYIRKSDEMTALKFAVGSCSSEVIKALIDNGADIDGPNDTDQTAFILAARYNDIESLKILLDAGANPNITCKLGWANGLNALEVAKLEKSKKSIAFLSSIYGT